LAHAGDVLQLSGGAAALHTGQWSPVAEQPPQAKWTLPGQQLLGIEHGRWPVEGAAKKQFSYPLSGYRLDYTETDE
jgi:hypothetical protein